MPTATRPRQPSRVAVLAEDAVCPLDLALMSPEAFKGLCGLADLTDDETYAVFRYGRGLLHADSHTAGNEVVMEIANDIRMIPKEVDRLIDSGLVKISRITRGLRRAQEPERDDWSQEQLLEWARRQGGRGHAAR